MAKRTGLGKGLGATFGEDVVEQQPAEQKNVSRETSSSKKTGMEQPEEFVRILEIYNRFPMEELIIHPRVQKDFYKNTPNLEIFGCALAESRNPVCYNGDIFTPADFARFTEEYRSVERVMTGRGVLRDPALAREIRGGRAADRNHLRRFHDLLYAGYCEEMSGDRTILFKMKEFWSYMAPAFADSKKYAKKIKKAEKCAVYEQIVEELFEKCGLSREESAPVCAAQPPQIP